METTPATPCVNCQRLQAEVDSLRQQLHALTAVVERLKTQLASARKDSSNSSKPPSSDIVKPQVPPTPLNDGKRRKGGQPGHPKHQRLLFPPETVTSFLHTLDACPCCSGSLRRNADFARVVEQIDVGPPPLTIEQHTSPEFWCDHCQKGYYAPMPASIENGGLVGPQLTALIAYLKGACHASYSTIRKFLRDVVQVTISRGQLAKVITKVSAALEGPYQELLDQLPKEKILNVDETGHKDNGTLMWTWCFRAELYTLFKIDAHRSADVLIQVLGEEFDGVLGCDYFSAYRRYMRECDVTVQFCLAHLIRDVKFLTTLPGQAEKAYGERLREALRALFRVIHGREEMPEKEFEPRLQAARDEVLRVGTTDVPESRLPQNLAKRLTKYGASYFTFVTTPRMAPTNNLAEQAIRFVVIDRLITQGTRGENGQRFCERIWSVMATCAQTGRSAWDYLKSAVESYFQGDPSPSLLAS